MTILFAGSFDPFTIGHYDILERIAPFCTKIVIAIGENIQKQGLLTVEQRKVLLETLFLDFEKNVEICSYHGLTADFCKAKKIRHLVRGIRNTTDFAFEQTLADANRRLYDLETVLLIAKAEYAHISATTVREIFLHGRLPINFLPQHTLYLDKLRELIPLSE